MIKTKECPRITPKQTRPSIPRHYRHTHFYHKHNSGFHRCVCGRVRFNQQTTKQSWKTNFIIVYLFKFVLNIVEDTLFLIEYIRTTRLGQSGVVSLLTGKHFGKFYGSISGGATGLVSYLWSPGLAGSYASAPDIAAHTLGDADIRVWVMFDMMAAPAASQYLVSHWATASRGWSMGINTAGKIVFTGSSDGTTDAVSVTPGNDLATEGLVAGTWYVLKVTFDADDGAGNRVVKTWRSADDGASFTLIGTSTVAGTFTLFNSTAPLEIGSRNGGVTPFPGKLKRVQFRSNILDDGTGIVFDEDFTTETEGAASVTEDSSNAATVTINGFAKITPLWAMAPVTAATVADTTSLSSYVTPSWVRKPNRLYVIAATLSINTGTPPTPTCTDAVVATVSAIPSGTAASGLLGTTMFVMKSGAGGTGTTTITPGAGTYTGCIIHVTEIDGADLSGTALNAILQSVSSLIDNAAVSPQSISLGSSPAATSRCVATFGIDTQGGITPRTNWIELADSNYATPATGQEIQWRPNASEQTASCTFSGTRRIRGIVIELKSRIQPFSNSIGAVDLTATTVSVGGEL